MSLRRAAVVTCSLLLGLAAPAVPAAASTKAAAAPTRATRLATVKAAKSLNYYPAANGWTAMWTNWNPARIDADLARGAALGATNVRVIVFPQVFGYPTPKAAYAARLATFVSLAAKHGMTVRLTLFDWWDAYADAKGSAAWATALLKPYANDKRVIAVELKNEINPDNAAVIAWAKRLIPAVRAAVPTMPLTLSVDGPTGAPGLAKIKKQLAATPLDYYDFHFYGNSERALSIIRTAQAAVSPAPIVIGEAGLNTRSNTEGEQAAFLARVFRAASAAGVRSVSPWTLNDFAAGAIPRSATAQAPIQYSYGLYRLNGTAKPAAAVVRSAWKGTALPASIVDSSFEAAAGQSPWRPYLPELGQAVRTSTVAHTGKSSIRFTRTGKTAAGSPSQRVAPIAPVGPGQKWKAEVWARGTAATGANQIALSWFDATDKWLGGANSASLPLGTTGWTKLTVTGTAPAGAASLQVHLKSGANTGAVWFDDAVLNPLH
ncbi:glycosyl hydrolase [Actinoplanes sp. NPDC049596]|uniref:glycosyl hydrolase n=1 Tax=unclassified Actinoplanes TaxID=2626549 RepID=UPI0034422B5A